MPPQSSMKAESNSSQVPSARVIARALAPLNDLLALAHPAMVQGAAAAFHKGQDFALEIDQASQYWGFDLVQHPSRIAADGVILEISNVRPKHG